MRQLYISAIYLSSVIFLSAQEVQWQRDLPSSSQDFLSGLSATIDRQFLVSGSTIQPTGMSGVSGISTDGVGSRSRGYDYHIVKLDQDGRPLWEKYYSGDAHDFLSSTVATEEGGFLIAGTSFSGRGGDKSEASLGGSDAWILKLDADGNIQWQRTLGTEKNDEVSSVVQSSDLGYFVSGNIQSFQAGFGAKDAWVAKLDRDGKVLDEILLGGTGTEEVQKVIPTKDGGALLTVYSRSGDASMLLSSRQDVLAKINGSQTMGRDAANSAQPAQAQKSETNIPAANKGENTSGRIRIRSLYAKQSASFGEGDYWIIKLDRDGRLQWQKNFGGDGDDHIRAVANTSTGYIVAGESRSRASGNKTENTGEGGDIWMISLDGSGNALWQKSFSFGKRDVVMSLDAIRDKEEKDKGFLVGGYTQSEGQAEGSEETFWMLYVDPKGQEVWRKHVKGKSRKKEERLVSAGLNTDGTYILAGTSAEELGREKWKVVKLGDKQVEQLVEKQDIRIYPNPVDDYCYVEIGEKFKEAEIGIYDMAGRLLAKTTTRTAVTRLDTSVLPQGVYIVTATAENLKLNAKIVKK